MKTMCSKMATLPVKAGGERGQALVEYSTMLAMFLGVTLILILLMSVFSEYGWRMISLVSLDL